MWKDQPQNSDQFLSQGEAGFLPTTESRRPTTNFSPTTND
jgi:hypothetical protein